MDWQLIGSSVRIARQNNNLSQEDLAELMNISYKYISELERGNKHPSLPMLFAFSDKLHVSMQFLTRGTDDPKEGTIPKETLFHVPEAKGISEKQYKTILKMTKDLVRNLIAIKE